MGLVEGPLEERPWFKRWVGLAGAVGVEVVGGAIRVVVVLFRVGVEVVVVVVVVVEVGLGGPALDEGCAFRPPAAPLGFLTVVLRGVTSLPPGITGRAEVVPLARVPTLL